MSIDIATGVLALRPRHGFDLDAAGGTIHAAHGVGEGDGNVPDWDEIEVPRSRHVIVSRARLSTTGAFREAVSPRDDFGDNANLVAFSRHGDGMVNEALEVVDFVE